MKIKNKMRYQHTLFVTFLCVTVSCTNQRHSHDSGESNTRNKRIEMVGKNPAFAGQIVFEKATDEVKSYFEKKNQKVTILPIFDDFYVAHFESSNSVAQVMKDLASVVPVIEPNFEVNIGADRASAAKASFPKWPKDPEFIKLWGINNIGQDAPNGIGGKPAADMQLLKTWSEVTTGSKDIIVGVIDTGIDFTHPDLKGNMWVNQKELAGSLGQDDDGNGYVDDIYGWNFVSNEANSNPLKIPGDNNPMDDNGHGTHCAGTIGAIANNGIGVTGVAWNVRLMPLKFLNAEGSGGNVDAARAIRYGVDQGANVLSNSWGGTASSELIKRAVIYAQKKGVVFVAAAGNSGEDNDETPHYPSNVAVSNVISVGATDNNDNKATFSNFGKDTVHVFAPGVNILSTIPTQIAQDKNYPYAVFSGTSMATPHVAGAVALLLSAERDLIGKPELVKKRLIETSDLNSKLTGYAAANGRINVYQATKNLVNKAQKITEAKQIDYQYTLPKYNDLLTDVRHTVTRPGASSIRIHFDFIQVEEPYDSLYLYDKYYNLVANFSKSEAADIWSPYVAGDTIHVRFVNSKVAASSYDVKTFDDAEEGFKKGARVCVPAGSAFQCYIPSAQKEFVSFNSEGFTIDKLAYTEGM